VKHQAAKKLKQFTSKHLPEILTKDPTLIWSVGKDILMVGQLQVRKTANGHYTVRVHNGFEQTFYKQKHAVCYASFYQTANMDRCNSIVILDHQLENYSHDVEHYKKRLTKYLKENNEDKFLLYYARYTQALPLKQRTEQECKKTIFLAKYN
jgi:hypothetical protein